MTGLALRTAITAAGLWLAAEIVSGIHIEGGWTILAAALLLGLVNAVLRPVIVFLTLPITVVTLGLFLLAINAGMLALVARLLSQFSIDGFGSALLGSVVVSLVSWAASWWIGPKGQVEVMIVRR
ncbi:MAG: phage holin family protein [Myxococcota bacterium]|nr:phage holin family protein [Myxococcota bacterium]